MLPKILGTDNVVTSATWADLCSKRERWVLADLQRRFRAFSWLHRLDSGVPKQGDSQQLPALILQNRECAAFLRIVAKRKVRQTVWAPDC